MNEWGGGGGGGGGAQDLRSPNRRLVKRSSHQSLGLT